MLDIFFDWACFDSGVSDQNEIRPMALLSGRHAVTGVDFEYALG